MLINFWYSFWKWPRLISDPFGLLLWVILRQSQKVPSFFKRKLCVRDMFPWLPESLAHVPFQTLPSSSHKTMSQEAVQSLRLLKETTNKAHDGPGVLEWGLLVWDCNLRSRNNSSSDNDWNHTTCLGPWPGLTPIPEDPHRAPDDLQHLESKWLVTDSPPATLLIQLCP